MLPLTSPLEGPGLLPAVFPQAMDRHSAARGACAQAWDRRGVRGPGGTEDVGQEGQRTWQGHRMAGVMITDWL